MYIKFKKADSDYGYDVRIYISKDNNGVIWFDRIDGVMPLIKGVFKETDIKDSHKMMVKSGTKIFLEKINNTQQKNPNVCKETNDKINNKMDGVIK